MAAPTWMDVLKSGGLSTACAETIINAGYDCQAGFAEAFVDSAALERFIKHLLLTLKLAGEVAADMWDIHPEAGKLRALWRSFRSSGAVPVPPARDETPGVTSQALALVASSGSGLGKIQSADRNNLKKELKAAYSSAVITPPATLPSLNFLQAIHSQAESAN